MRPSNRPLTIDTDTEIDILRVGWRLCWSCRRCSPPGSWCRQRRSSSHRWWLNDPLIHQSRTCNQWHSPISFLRLPRVNSIIIIIESIERLVRISGFSFNSEYSSCVNEQEQWGEYAKRWRWLMAICQHFWGWIRRRQWRIWRHCPCPRSSSVRSRWRRAIRCRPFRDSFGIFFEDSFRILQDRRCCVMLKWHYLVARDPRGVWMDSATGLQGSAQYLRVMILEILRKPPGKFKGQGQGAGGGVWFSRDSSKISKDSLQFRDGSKMSLIAFQDLKGFQHADHQGSLEILPTLARILPSYPGFFGIHWDSLKLVRILGKLPGSLRIFEDFWVFFCWGSLRILWELEWGKDSSRFFGMIWRIARHLEGFFEQGSGDP